MRALLRSGLIGLAIIASLVPLWPVYGTAWVGVVIVAGVAGGSAIAAISVARNWSVLRTALVTLAAFFVIGVPLAIPSKALFGVVPTLDGLVSLASAIVSSWKELVTVVAPVASYQALLVPALMTSLAGSVVGVSLALRPRHRAIAAAVPVLVLGLAIWLGPAAGFESAAVSALVFLLLVVWFAVTGPRGTRGILRALGVVAVPLLIALVFISILGPVSRTVWRSTVQQPFVLQTDTSPLAEYRSYVTGPGASTLLLTATGLTPGERISLATLDSYNGVVYSVGGSAADFTRVPGSIAIDSQQGRQVDSVITVGSAQRVWVPLPAELGSIAFEGATSVSVTSNFFYSREADTAAVMGGLPAGATYRVTGVQHPLATLSEVVSLTPGTAVVPAPTVVPEGLLAYVTRNVPNAQSPGEELARVLAALHSDGYVSNGGAGESPSRSGHGAERIAQLFTQVPMVGDAEQYATAAALLAEQVGFPARVVMGLVVPASTGATTSDADIALTGATMSAWIEVSTTQGWVAIDPNPEVRPVPDRLPVDPSTVTRPQSAAEPPPIDAPRVQANTPPEVAAGELTPVADPFQTTLGVVFKAAASALLIAGILASPFVAIAAFKARRQSRRRSARLLEDRIEGAWEEFVDMARDHGFILTDSLTRREMAKRIPQERSVALAKLIDRAQFAPGEPTQAQADEAWRSVEQIREGLDAPLSRWQRLRSHLSLLSVAGTTVGRLMSRFQVRPGPRR